MAIILEGPDNSGKSTLAKKIEEMYGLEVLHAGGPCKDPIEAQSRAFYDIMNMQRPVVMDRSFIVSEPIYSDILGRDPVFDPKPWIRKMQALDQHESTFLLVFCDAPDSILLNMKTHIIKPGEDERHIAAVKAQQYRLAQAYRQMCQYASLFMNCVQIQNTRDAQEVKDFLYELPSLVRIQGIGVAH